jgi:hypothetical protein
MVAVPSLKVFGGGLIILEAGLVLVPRLPIAANDFLRMTGFGELELASTVILESVPIPCLTFGAWEIQILGTTFAKTCTAMGKKRLKLI